MSMKHFAIAAFLVAAPCVIVSSGSVVAAPLTAQAWQPIARISPNQPYRIRLNNRSGTTLEYASTTNEFSPRRLQPGMSTTLTQLPLPIYLLISAVDPSFNLQFSVSASQNIVTVDVQPLPEDTPGKTTVNIQQTGGIFVY